MSYKGSKLLKSALVGMITLVAGIIPAVSADVAENSNNKGWIGGIWSDATYTGDQRWSTDEDQPGFPAGYGIVVTDGHTVEVNSGVTIGDDASIDPRLLPTIDVNSSDAGVTVHLTNNGTIYAKSVNVLAGALQNNVDGEIEVVNGTLTNNTAVYNAGSISSAIANAADIVGVQTSVDGEGNPVYTYGTLTLTDDSTNSGSIVQDTITLATDKTLTNDGSIKANTKLVNNGTVTNNATGSIEAAVIENNNKIVNNGVLKTVMTNTLDGTVEGNGTIETIGDSSNTGTLLQSLIVDEGVTYENTGKIGTDQNNQVDKITNNGTFNNNGTPSTAIIWAKEIENSGDFTSSGRLNNAGNPVGKVTNNSGGTFTILKGSNANIGDLINKEDATVTILQQTIVNTIDNSGEFNLGSDTTNAKLRMNGSDGIMKVTNNQGGEINIINGSLGINGTTKVEIDNAGSITTTQKGEIVATSVTNQKTGDITIEGTSLVQEIDNTGVLNIGTDSGAGIIRHDTSGSTTTVTNQADGTINVVNGSLGMTKKTNVELNNAGTVNNSSNGSIYATNITNSGEFNNEGYIARAAKENDDTYVNKITNETGGQFNNKTGATILVYDIENGTDAAFINNGTLKGGYSGGRVNITNAGEFQTGTITATLTNSGEFTGIKTYDGEGNVTSTLDDYGSLYLVGSSTNSSTGTIAKNYIEINSNGTLTNSGSVYANSLILDAFSYGHVKLYNNSNALIDVSNLQLAGWNGNASSITNYSDATILADTIGAQDFSGISNYGNIGSADDKVSEINLSGGYIANNSGGKVYAVKTTIDGGSLTTYSGSTYDSESIDVKSGSITNGGKLSTGDLQNAGSVYNSGTINAFGITNKAGATLTNNGTIGVGSNGITNSGTLNINSSSAKINTPTLTNNSTGTINNSGYLGTSDGYINTLTNNGTINNNGNVYATNFTNIEGATVTNTSGTYAGNLYVTGNSSNEGSIAQNYISNSGTFINDGTMTSTGSGIYNAANAVIKNSAWGKGTLTSRGGNNYGYIAQATMTVIGNGHVFTNDGSAGGWSNGCIQVTDFNVEKGGSFVNASSSRLYATGTVTNNGNITNNSSGTYGGMHINTVNNYGSLVNNGKIAKDDSASSATINNGVNGSNVGTITNNAGGTITVNQINNRTTSNVITNNGAITAAIDNYGRINGNGTGTLTLTGNTTNHKSGDASNPVLASIANQSKITVNSGVTLDNDGTIGLYINPSNNNRQYGLIGEIENYGRVNNNSGAEVHATTITNKGGGVFKSWGRIGAGGNEVQNLRNESGATFRLLGSNAQMHVNNVENQNGAIITVETNGSGMRTQTITNAGQIDIGNTSTGVGGSETTGIVLVSEKLTNTGSINVNKGYLGQNGDKVIPTVENSGSIVVDTAGTMYAANIDNTGSGANIKVFGRMGDSNNRVNINNNNIFRTLGESAKLYAGNINNNAGLTIEGTADVSSIINKGAFEIGATNVAGGGAAGTVIGSYVENYTVTNVKKGSLGVGEEGKMVTLNNHGTINVDAEGEIYAGSITNKAKYSTDTTVINNKGNISVGGMNNYATVNNESGADMHAQNFRNYSVYNNKAGSHSYLVALQNGGVDAEGNSYNGTVNNDGYIISAIRNEAGSTISGSGILTVNNTNAGTPDSIDSYNKGTIIGLSELNVDNGAKLTNEKIIGTATSKIDSMTVKGEFANNSADGVYAVNFTNEGITTSTGRFGNEKNRIQNLTNKGSFTQNSGSKSYVFAENMVNEGLYTNNTGDLNVVSLTNANNASLINKKKLVAETVDNSGRLELTGTGYMTTSSLTNDSTGVIVNAGKIGYAVNTDTLTPVDKFINNGGNVTNTGEIYVKDLTNELNSYIYGNGKIEMSGTSSNSGIIEGNIINSGTLTNMRDLGRTDSPENTVIVNSGSIISIAEKIAGVDDTFNTAIYAKSFTNTAEGDAHIRKLHVTELVDNYGNLDIDFQLGEREDSDGNVSQYKIDQINNHTGANITIGSTTGREDAEIVAKFIQNDGTITANQKAYIDELVNTVDFTNNGPVIQLGKLTNTTGANFILNNGKIGAETEINLMADSYTEVTNKNTANVMAELTLDKSDIINGKVENNGGKLTLQGIDTLGIAGIIQQNDGDLVLTQHANFQLAPDAMINGGNLAIYDSSLNTSTYPTLSVGRLDLNNGMINMQNGDITTINATDLIAAGKNDLIVEMDPRKLTTDAIVVSGNGVGNGNFHVADYRFIGEDPIQREIQFQIVDVKGDLDDNMNFSVVKKAIDTPLGKYSLFSKGGGLYAAKLVEYNPQMYRGQAVTMAAYNTQLMIDDLVLSHIPLESEHALITSANDNKYALADNSIFAPYHHTKEEGGLWYKSYVDIETLALTHNMKVNNTAYGSVIGADLPMKYLKNGWKYIATPYIIYNGASQSFNGVHAYHNGGQGGFMSTFMRGDFTGGITAYGGGYSTEMHIADTTDNKGNWFAGVATKASYNLRATDHFTIQPTLFASYNAFGRQKWHSNFGNMDMRTGMFNGVSVAPGANFIYARDTWSLYLTTKYMYNINDQVSGRAGDVDLPNIRMRHGYIEYGIGGSKIWKDKFSTYAQFVFRHAGRSGIGMQLGLQYFFGSNLNTVEDDSKKEVKVSNKTKVKKVKDQKLQKVKVEKEKVEKVKAQKEVKAKTVAPEKEPVVKQQTVSTTETTNVQPKTKTIIKQLPNKKRK